MKRAWVLCVALVGCAAQRKDAAPASAAPTRSNGAESVDEGKATTSTGADAKTGTSAPPAAPVMPGSGGASGAVVTPENIGKAQYAFEDASKAFSAAGADCAQLCKALHSMTHATERLCELTQDQRCNDARSRVDAATAKVKSSCGVCTN